MADMTKCKGEGCPHKETCYRFTVEADELRQSYFVESPIKDGKCSMYWGEDAQSIWNTLKDIVNGN